jgi:hypothetical protein
MLGLGLEFENGGCLIKARRTGPTSTGTLTVKVEAEDVESGAEDLSTAAIIVKRFDLVTFADGETGTKEIQFQCVDKSNARFAVEGNGSVTLTWEPKENAPARKKKVRDFSKYEDQARRLAENAGAMLELMFQDLYLNG